MSERSGWAGDKRSRQERGYGAAWDRLRLQILKRDSFRCQCSDCKRDRRILPANEVDHIVSKANWLKQHGNLDGCDSPSNLQAINTDCHKLKTKREMGMRPTLGGDVHGNPADPGHHWNR